MERRRREELTFRWERPPGSSLREMGEARLAGWIWGEEEKEEEGTNEQAGGKEGRKQEQGRRGGEEEVAQGVIRLRGVGWFPPFPSHLWEGGFDPSRETRRSGEESWSGSRLWDEGGSWRTKSRRTRADERRVAWLCFAFFFFFSTDRCIYRTRSLHSQAQLPYIGILNCEYRSFTSRRAGRQRTHARLAVSFCFRRVFHTHPNGMKLWVKLSFEQLGLDMACDPFVSE